MRGTGERIQKLLPPKSCLVDILRVRWNSCLAGCDLAQVSGPEEVYVAFVCCSNRPGEMTLVSLGAAAEIDEAIHELRRLITRRDDPIITNATSESNHPISLASLNQDPNEFLYSRLVAAIADWFKDCLTLYICPDGELARIPFEVLRSAEGRFLAELLRVVYLSNTRELLNWGKRVGPAERSVVVADVNFDLSDSASDSHTSGQTQSTNDKLRDVIQTSHLAFRPLEATRHEGEVVSELLNARKLFGDDATSPAARKLRSPKILHICTHGFFLPKTTAEVDQWGFAKEGLLKSTTGWLRGVGLEDPNLRSGLALAGANTKVVGKRPSESAGSGFLTAEDIGYMNLEATELVTLSACDTGLGDIDAGEGVIGLRQSVVAAGARSLVLSLWKVSDDATYTFMETFYNELCGGSGKDRIDAFRIAQTKLREEYSDDPFYWGAFICQGYPGPIRQEVEGDFESDGEHSDGLIAGNVFAPRVNSGYSVGSLDHLQKIVKRAGMVFNPPSGFTEICKLDLEVFQADYAIKCDNGALEILYAIRPEIDYPEQFDTSDFLTLITDLSGGQSLNMEEFPRDAVKREFGAEWGLHAAFAPEPSVYEGVMMCNAVAIHKDGCGTAIILYMIGEVAAMQVMLSVFERLQFQTE